MSIYYEALNGEPLAFCADYRLRLIAQREVFYAFAKSKGARGWVGGWGDLWGLVYDHDAERPKGLIADKRRTLDGETRWRPHGKSPEGKALSAEFAALGREPRGSEFSTRFDIPQQLSYADPNNPGHHGAMGLTAIFPESAFIGWTGSGDADLTFWVVLPDIDGIIAGKTAEGYVCAPNSWTLPDGLKRSSRARYDLALAAAKVAEEDAA